MVGCCYFSRKYLTPATILFLYKSQIKEKWSIAAITGLELPNPQSSKGLPGLVDYELFSNLQPQSHRRNVEILSLIYTYYCGKCSKKRHSLVPSNFTLKPAMSRSQAQIITIHFIVLWYGVSSTRIGSSSKLLLCGTASRGDASWPLQS